MYFNVTCNLRLAALKLLYCSTSPTFFVSHRSVCCLNDLSSLLMSVFAKKLVLLRCYIADIQTTGTLRYGLCEFKFCCTFPGHQHHATLQSHHRHIWRFIEYLSPFSRVTLLWLKCALPPATLHTNSSFVIWRTFLALIQLSVDS